MRRPRPEVLIGGSPLRVLRLTAGGAELVDRWLAGAPVGPSPAAGRLAGRLVDAGLAAPVPDGSYAPSLAVVVPVLDDQAGLDATLAAFSNRPDLAVTVVDDGSRRPLAAAGADLRHRPATGGPAAARNTGLRSLATVDIVVFLDAGCVPDAGALDLLAGHFADPAVAAVAPRIVTPAGSGARAVYEAGHSPLDLGPVGGVVGPGRLVPYVPSTLLAVRRSALLELQGFDERLRYGEDVDLVWRLVAAGHRVIYEPAARATHPTRRDLPAWLRQRYDYGTSAAPLAERHGRAVSPLSVQPWSAAAWAFLAAGYPLAAVALAGGSAWALGRRSDDPVVARELRRLAVAGHLRAGRPLASAIRRAWLPPAALAAVLLAATGGRRRRLAVMAAASVVVAGPGLADWSVRRPPVGPVAWAALSLVDDLAYQAGVWAGAARHRSPAALLPKW